MVLGLLLSGNAYADNIKDFQIEGISLGDSALKHYSENEIKTNKKNGIKAKSIQHQQSMIFKYRINLKINNIF